MVPLQRIRFRDAKLIRLSDQSTKPSVTQLRPSCFAIVMRKCVASFAAQVALARYTHDKQGRHVQAIILPFLPHARGFPLPQNSPEKEEGFHRIPQGDTHGILEVCLLYTSD